MKIASIMSAKAQQETPNRPEQGQSQPVNDKSVGWFKIGMPVVDEKLTLKRDEKPDTVQTPKGFLDGDDFGLINLDKQDPFSEFNALERRKPFIGSEAESDHSTEDSSIEGDSDSETTLPSRYDTSDAYFHKKGTSSEDSDADEDSLDSNTNEDSPVESSYSEYDSEVSIHSDDTTFTYKSTLDSNEASNLRNYKKDIFKDMSIESSDSNASPNTTDLSSLSDDVGDEEDSDEDDNDEDMKIKPKNVPINSPPKRKRGRPRKSTLAKLTDVEQVVNESSASGFLEGLAKLMSPEYFRGVSPTSLVKAIHYLPSASQLLFESFSPHPSLSDRISLQPIESL